MVRPSIDSLYEEGLASAPTPHGERLDEMSQIRSHLENVRAWIEVEEEKVFDRRLRRAVWLILPPLLAWLVAKDQVQMIADTMLKAAGGL